MPLSQYALQAALRSQTDVVFLECLKLETPENTLRLVNDLADLQRNDGTYIAFPFKGKVTSSKDNPPKLEIIGDAVDQRLMLEIRSLAGSRDDIKLTYSVVTKQQPDMAEYGPTTFKLDSISADSYLKVKITCTLLIAALTDAYPARQISPSQKAVA